MACHIYKRTQATRQKPNLTCRRQRESNPRRRASQPGYQYFGSPGDAPRPNVTVWVVWYINPPLATCKISSCSDDASSRYLLPHFVDFVVGMTHEKTPTKNKCISDGLTYVDAWYLQTPEFLGRNIHWPDP